MNKDILKKNSIVFIKLKTHDIIYGNINTLGFDRSSDFLLDDRNVFFTVYNASLNGDPSSNLSINKDSIAYMKLIKEGKI